MTAVGTGGDGARTVNISTMAAIVAAGAGARVVKHGNRSASSKSGTADVLEELGVRLDLSAERVASVVEAGGITFLFAAAFHPSMRHAAICVNSGVAACWRRYLNDAMPTRRPPSLFARSA